MKMSNLVLRDAGRRDLVLDGPVTPRRRSSRRRRSSTCPPSSHARRLLREGHRRGGGETLEVNATIPRDAGATRTPRPIRCSRSWAARGARPITSSRGGCRATATTPWRSTARCCRDYAQVRPGKVAQHHRPLEPPPRRNSPSRSTCARKFREWGADADVVHPISSAAPTR